MEIRDRKLAASVKTAALVLRPFWLLLAVLLVGCGGGPGTPADVFPGTDDVPGWTPAGDVRVFDSESLFDLVNGQADAYFAYGFERVETRGYESATDTIVDIEIWQVATMADAYGLYTANRSGDAVEIGGGGDADSGRRLAFWQDRYYVRVRARQAVDDTDLKRFAESVSAALPSGGERPALVDRLPPGGLMTQDVVFFHQEISIQDELWLGGENLLALGPETNGILARYDVGGATALLLLVRYLDGEAAAAGLDSLAVGSAGDLVTADVRGDVLGAVFGDVDEIAASALLAEALGNE